MLLGRWVYEHDVSGVPFFSIDGGKYQASGAQEPAYFVRLFERIAAQRNELEAKAAVAKAPVAGESTTTAAATAASAPRGGGGGDDDAASVE